MNSEFSTKELVNECVLGLVCFTYCITFLKMITLKFFTRGNMVILKNNTFLMPGLFYSRILCFDLNSPGKVLLICILRKDWRRDQSISIFVFNLPKTKGNKDIKHWNLHERCEREKSTVREKGKKQTFYCFRILASLAGRELHFRYHRVYLIEGRSCGKRE